MNEWKIYDSYVYEPFNIIKENVDLDTHMHIITVYVLFLNGEFTKVCYTCNC